MQATFFATDNDLLQVVAWFLDVPGMTLFEPYSRPDLPNRRFSSVEDVAPFLKERGWTLAAWREATGVPPRPQHIDFDSDTQRKLGARGRTVLRSPSIIGIGRNNEQNGCLSSSTISCWNEKGARQRSIHEEDVLNEVDWAALRSTVAGLQRKLSKAAPAKLGSHPIMGDAFARMRAGELKLWNWGSACAFPSPLITVA